MPVIYKYELNYLHGFLTSVIVHQQTCSLAFLLCTQDIKAGTGIEDKELRRTLQSLACGKVRW